jgi:ribonuclease-3
MSLESLQQRLGYRFSDPDLLRQALTHRSFGQPNNERLEFLGDSVLNCTIAALLFEQFSTIDEGDLSRSRANLVKQQSLYEIAQRIELSQYLLLGEGELRSGGFRRPSILGDTLEAVFGAVFLDGGFGAARAVIAGLYSPILRNVDPRTLGKDAKTLLQEYLQGRRIPLPVYAVVATHGAAHSQTFEVECAIPKLDIRVLGGGGSRRAAEQAAAKLALEAAAALMPAGGKRARGRPAPAPAPVPARDGRMHGSSAEPAGLGSVGRGDARGDRTASAEERKAPGAGRASADAEPATESATIGAHDAIHLDPVADTGLSAAGRGAAMSDDDIEPPPHRARLTG